MEELNSRPSPFPVGNMITDPGLFHGRKKESEDLFNRLRKMESTSIVGPRRIGKSSLAYHIYSSGPSTLGSDYVFVWLDGQSNHLASMERMFAQIATAADFRYTPGRTQSDCLIEFEDRLLDLPKRLVIVINEFEILTDDDHRTEFPRSFYNTLRMLAERARCALITTSHLPLTMVCANVLEVSSPFYNIFAQIPVSEFSTEEVGSFLTKKHLDFQFTSTEKELICKRVTDHQHPLILQIAADAIFMNRTHGVPETRLVSAISNRARGYLSHQEIQEGRRLKQETNRNTPRQLSKALDLTVSIMVPIAGLAVLMLEFGLLMQRLSLAQAILLGLVTMILGFGTIVFAGRSIDIIAESTFFKIFMKLIDQMPLLSRIVDRVQRHVSNPLDPATGSKT